MKKNPKPLLFFLCVVLAFFAVSCSVLLGAQQTDTQALTLTAMATPLIMQPTLDLKGNAVIEMRACLVAEPVSVSIFSDTENGGIFNWDEHSNKLALVAPENRYWGWFSGDAVILDFGEDDLIPQEMSTTAIKVFGDFAFNPSSDRIAFVAFRPSDKVYTLMSASLTSNLAQVIDLFPGVAAETDNFSGEKSVLEWQDDSSVRVSASCGIDCEMIYVVNVLDGTMFFENETRKKEHDGRTFKQNIREYDVRFYPVMNNPNWSLDNNWIFYTDAQNKTWILNDRTKEQFELPISGRSVLQSAWSYDGAYLALRLEERIQVYKIECLR